MTENKDALSLYSTLIRCTGLLKFCDAWRKKSVKLDIRDLRNLIEAVTRATPPQDAMRKALEPFARALDDWGDDPSKCGNFDIWEHPTSINITLDHLRDAKAALFSPEPESVRDTRAALAEAIEALEALIGLMRGNEMRSYECDEVYRAAQVVAKHGEGW